MSFDKTDQVSGKEIRDNQNKNCIGSICSHKYDTEAAEDRLGCVVAAAGHIKEELSPSVLTAFFTCTFPPRFAYTLTLKDVH